MALDKCRVIPQSNVLNNGGGDKEYQEIPHENDSSDSDSGNSIFLTQADTPAPPLRKVRRRRHGAPSQSFTSSLSDCADSESEEASASIEPHNEADSRQQPGSCKQKKPEIPHVPKRPIHFPFLEKYYGLTRLNLHQQQTLVNSSIGGFFLCMKHLTDKSKKPELSLSPVSDVSSLEEETEDLEDQDCQDDIRIVDRALFVQNLHKRNRQEWCSNTKNAPSKTKKTKKRPSNTKDLSKAPITGQSRRSKQSSHSEVKNTRRGQVRRGQNMGAVSKTPGIGQGQTRRSERHTVKRTNAQNLADHGSCSSSEEGSEMRDSDNSSVLQTSQTSTSRPADASDTEDEQADNDQTHTEVNQLQTQSLSLESTECEPLQRVVGVASFSESSGEGVSVCEVTTGQATSMLTQVTSNTACLERNKRQSSEKPDTDDTDSENADARLTLDDDSQSTSEPQASQQVSSIMVSSESYQGSSGGNNSIVLHHVNKRKQKKKRQSETYSEHRIAFSKDRDKSDLGGGDSQHKAAPQMTRNSLRSEELYKTGKCLDPVSVDEWNPSQDYSCTPVQCVELSTVPNVEDKRVKENSSSQNMVPSSICHKLSQKKKRTVDKDQTDTVQRILQGTSRLTASESCVRLGQSETETCSDAVQEEEESQSQEQTGNDLGASQPQPKTQIQLAVGSDAAASQDCEMLSVDGDSSSVKKKRKKKKKKHKKDCMESVDECSASREVISISQDITVSSAFETEIEISSQKNRKKHKRKDRVQQDSQEQAYYQPEDLTDQPRDRKKNKKKLCKTLTSGHSPPAFSTVERLRDSQHSSSSQVCEVADFDGNSVTLNTSAKKNKRNEDTETVTEEFTSHKDASSVSPENQGTSLPEVIHKKKRKRRKHDSEHGVLEDGTNLVSDDQRLVQQTGTEAQQAQVSPEQIVKPSDGSDSGRKRKKDGCGTCPSNVYSTADAESEVSYKKKKKKKRHRSENSCELGITTSEDNGSQGQQEVHKGERSYPIVCSSEKEKDHVQVYSSAPEGHHVEQRESSSKKKRKKRETLLDTDDVNPEESLCLSLIPHKKKKKKKGHDET